MKFIKTALLFLLCFSVSSCNIKKEIPDHSEVPCQTSQASEKNCQYYTSKRTDFQDSGLIDIVNKKYYFYNFKHIDKTSYKSASDPECSKPLPDDITEVFKIIETESLIYLYCQVDSNCYSVKTFDHSMNEYGSTEFESKYLYHQICLNENNEMFTSYNDDNGSYLRKLSSDGTVLKDVKTDTFPEYTSHDLDIRDLTVTKNGNLAVAVNSPVGASVYLLNSDLEYIDRITNESIGSIYSFAYNKDKIILAEQSESDDTYNCYEIDEASKKINYITSVNGIESIRKGTGNYDYLISRNGIIYGYTVSSDKEEALCDDENAVDFFSVNDTVYYTTSDTVTSLELYSKDFSGNIEELYHLDNCGLLNHISFKNDDHILFSESHDEEKYYIYDVDIKTGKSSKTELVTETSSTVSSILINTDTMLVYSYDKETDLDALTLYDRNGTKLSEIDTDDYFYYFALYNNNYILAMMDGESAEYYCALLNSKDYSVTKMDINISNEFEMTPFFKNGKLYMMNQEGIYLIEETEDTFNAEPVVCFDNSDIPKDANINSFYYCNEEIYLRYNDILYKLIPDENAAPKDTLEIAIINTPTDELSIQMFEKQNPSCKIKTVKYDSLEGDFTDKWNRMIISDDVPDLIITSAFSDESFSIQRDNNKNAYIDLYELIEKDNSLDKKCFKENILKALDYKGKLYQISPYYSIMTILGNKSQTQQYVNWNFDQFSDFVDQNRDKAFIRNDNAYISEIALNLSPFWNFEKSEAYFNTDKFKKLIETVDSFAYDVPRNSHPLMHNTVISDFNAENLWKKTYFEGNEIINIGYPEISGNGAMVIPDKFFSIPSKSKNPDKAWEYIKVFFSKEYYEKALKNGIRQFPLHNDLFNDMAEKTKKNTGNPNSYGAVTLGFDTMNQPVECGIPDDKSIDFVKNIIDNANSLYLTDNQIYTIIEEEHSNYTNNDISLDKMAKNIQNRTTIYLNERS